MVRPSHLRGTLAIITPYWGEQESESVALVRLVAGALATAYQVEVIVLDEAATAPSMALDSAFRIHRLPAPADPRRQFALVGELLTRSGGDASLPASITSILFDTTTLTEPLREVLMTIDPATILLIGTYHPYDLALLRTASDRRILLLPISEDRIDGADERTGELLDLADAVIAIHPGAERALATRTTTPVVPLDLALTVNRNAMRDTLFGVRFYQPFVLLLRSFPGGTSHEATMATVTHEIITAVAGPVRREEIPEENWRYAYEEIPEILPISVAEVNGASWHLADERNLLPLPVNPSRVNLWRLMAHALFLIDLRQPMPFGREAIESMLLGTPVIVPATGAAREHVAAADGGLWYRDNGELLDCVRVMTDRSIRDRLGRQGLAYATDHHGDVDAFVARICALALPA